MKAILHHSQAERHESMMIFQGLSDRLAFNPSNYVFFVTRRTQQQPVKDTATALCTKSSSFRNHEVANSVTEQYESLQAKD